MAANINRVLLAGNLTRDPQVKFLANERAVANFGLAINRRYKSADGQLKEETTFVDVEAWGRTAELVGQYLVKGRAAFIEGYLKLDSWDDKDGQKRSKLKVVADNVQFLDSGNRGEGRAAAGGASDAPGGSGASNGDQDSAPARPAAAPVRPSAPAGGSVDDEPPF